MNSFHFEDIPLESIINQASVPDPALNRQGCYTRRDFLQYPTHSRVQLINGFLIIPPPVPAIHQRIITELLYQCTRYLKGDRLPFKAVSAPVRFFREEDERTVLLPDLAIVRYPDSILSPDISVLPDFAAEVTTRDTHCLDHTVKPWIYKDWGVKEYWIINPSMSSIEIYLFADDPSGAAKTYIFGNLIPVRAFPGLFIDTSEFL